jgi:hypothetical protein
MTSSIIPAQNQARARIQETWKAIAENYTTAWMGPIEAVETVFLMSQATSLRSDVPFHQLCQASFTKNRQELNSALT